MAFKCQRSVLRTNGYTPSRTNPVRKLQIKNKQKKKRSRTWAHKCQLSFSSGSGDSFTQAARLDGASSGLSEMFLFWSSEYIPDKYPDVWEDFWSSLLFFSGDGCSLCVLQQVGSLHCILRAFENQVMKNIILGDGGRSGDMWWMCRTKMDAMTARPDRRKLIDA